MKFSFRALVTVALLTLSVACFADDKEDEAIRKQALNVFQVFKQRDWKGLFNASEFSATVKKDMTDPELFATKFAEGLKESDPDNAFGKLFDGMTEIKVGGVAIEGGKARVATSCVITVDKKAVPFLGVATFIKVGKDWKWDLSFSDEPETVTSQRLEEFIGAPSTP